MERIRVQVLQLRTLAIVLEVIKANGDTYAALRKPLRLII
jgi:hypothetical protein